MELTVYSMLYLFSGLISLLTGFLAYKRINAVGAKELILLMFVATFWSLCIFLESMLTSVQGKILLSQISYPAVLATPVFYYIFISRFVGKKTYRKWLDYIPLFIVPSITLVLVWTNNHHHLFWTSFSEIDPETNLIQYFHGIGYFIGAFAYSYLLIVICVFRLFAFIFFEKSKMRGQAWVLLFGALTPIIASLLYLMKLNFAVGFDLTPWGISFSGMLFIVAILNFRLLELVPISKDVLLECVQEGVLVLDENNVVQDINVAAKQYLGIMEEIIPGTPFNKLNIRYSDWINPILSGASFNHLVIQNEEVHLVYQLNTLPLNTRPKSRLIFIRDITELAQKQEAADRSDKEYRTLYHLFRMMSDNMPDLLWAKDLNRKYIFVNKAVCDTILQATNTEEPIGKTRDEFIQRESEKHPDNPDWHNIGRFSGDTDQIVLQTGKPGVFEEFGYLKGTFCYLDIRKAPIYNENGEMVGIVGSARDITHQKKTEIELIAAKERAQEADRLKSSFLANMSHEVRTPMNSILGFISLMQESSPTPEEQKEYFSIVKQGGERLMNTINDIIDLSRIDSGQMLMNLGEINISELNNIVHSVFLPDAKAKNLNLTFAGIEPNEDIVLKTDRSKLYTILSKLIKNAIKYTQRGEVRFGCRYDSETICYFVEDTGIGIAKNRHQDIFDRFVQVDGSINRDYEGSGLGLSLCKAYVEMMGGTIWVESEEGKGSTFYFRLPLDSNLSVSNQEEPSDASGFVKKFFQILIVEDDPGSFEYLNLILSREGHQITHTYTGFEAIELCRQKNSFDLILMDVKLPGIDGYETTRRIRDFNQSLPIIAVSAFAFSEDHERAIMAGCNDYVTKPVNKDLLLGHLKKMMAKRL